MPLDETLLIEREVVDGWTILASSWVDAAQYDGQGGVLSVRFKNGFVATYNVPGETFDALVGAASPGTFVRQHLYALPYAPG